MTTRNDLIRLKKIVGSCEDNAGINFASLVTRDDSKMPMLQPSASPHYEDADRMRSAFLEVVRNELRELAQKIVLEAARYAAEQINKKQLLKLLQEYDKKQKELMLASRIISVDSWKACREHPQLFSMAIKEGRVML